MFLRLGSPLKLGWWGNYLGTLRINHPTQSQFYYMFNTLHVIIIIRAISSTTFNSLTTPTRFFPRNTFYLSHNRGSRGLKMSLALLVISMLHLSLSSSSWSSSIPVYLLSCFLQHFHSPSSESNFATTIQCDIDKVKYQQRARVQQTWKTSPVYHFVSYFIAYFSVTHLTSHWSSPQ